MQQQHLQMPPMSMINKVFIAICVVMFLITTAFQLMGLPLVGILGLSLDNVTSGHIYELVTYPFAQTGLFSVLFNCLLIWFLGTDIQNILGGKKYVGFLTSVIIGAGIIYLLFSTVITAASYYPLHGLNGVCSAMLLIYAIHFPERYFSFMLIFPIQAKYFCGLIIAIEIFQGISSPAGAGSWGHLAAMGVGYLFVKFDPMDKLPKLPKRPKSRPNHLKLVDQEETKPGKYWH